jgi:hypothetical protein
VLNAQGYGNVHLVYPDIQANTVFAAKTAALLVPLHKFAGPVKKTI